MNDQCKVVARGPHAQSEGELRPSSPEPVGDRDGECSVLPRGQVDPTVPRRPSEEVGVREQGRGVVVLGDEFTLLVRDSQNGVQPGAERRGLDLEADVGIRGNPKAEAVGLTGVVEPPIPGDRRTETLLGDRVPFQGFGEVAGDQAEWRPNRGDGIEGSGLARGNRQGQRDRAGGCEGSAREPGVQGFSPRASQREEPGSEGFRRDSKPVRGVPPAPVELVTDFDQAEAVVRNGNPPSRISAQTLFRRGGSERTSV